MDMNSERRWDSSLLTKEEAVASFLSKKEAAIKRERIREYWFNRRVSFSIMARSLFRYLFIEQYFLRMDDKKNKKKKFRIQLNRSAASQVEGGGTG